MRWIKIAGIAAGVVIGYLVVSAVIGLVIYAVIGGLAAAAIYFGVKAAYRNKQVGRKRPDRELPRQQAPDVDDELTRLRREMRS
jgi:F0F1-type ATP synthase assembly protein I